LLAMLERFPLSVVFKPPFAGFRSLAHIRLRPSTHKPCESSTKFRHADA
jgi:hypothetical protein